MKRTRTLLFAASALLFAFPPFAHGEGLALGRQCDTPQEVLIQRQITGVVNPRTEVIDNESDWCAFWDEVHAIQFPAPPCDPDLVDFDVEVVLVAALGGRPNLCYNIAFSCIQDLGVSGNVRARIQETVPDVTCPCLQATAQPVAAVKIPKPDKRVIFQNRTELLDCGP